MMIAPITMNKYNNVSVSFEFSLNFNKFIWSIWLKFKNSYLLSNKINLIMSIQSLFILKYTFNGLYLLHIDWHYEQKGLGNSSFSLFMFEYSNILFHPNSHFSTLFFHTTILFNNKICFIINWSIWWLKLIQNRMIFKNIV